MTRDYFPSSQTGSGSLTSVPEVTSADFFLLGNCWYTATLAE